MKIAIIGGGFCGAYVAKKLQKVAEITLFDKREYFEYTPAITKVLIEPDYVDKIRIPYSTLLKKVNVVTTPITNVTPTFVQAGKKYHFDYAVICTGFSYPIFMENKEKVYTVTTGDIAATIAREEKETILVIGGGMIGIEAIAEFAMKTKKQIHVVDPMNRLIARSPEKAAKYAKELLEKKGVIFYLEEKTVEHTGKRFKTDKGTVIEADIALWCAGIKRDASFMKGFENILEPDGSLKTNKNLQLEGYPNIFVGGDISGIKEEKIAQNAELHATVIIENIKRLQDKKPLKDYSSAPRIIVISLGDWKGIITYKNFVWTGFIPAMLKMIVEKFVMVKYKYF